MKIEICMGSSCFARGNGKVLEVVKDWIRGHDGDGEVQLVGHLCQRMCARGPILVVEGVVYEQLTPATALDILNDHFDSRVAATDHGE